jgi:leader peptidase (prepilin peptidase)/N-methyltransferase
MMVIYFILALAGLMAGNLSGSMYYRLPKKIPIYAFESIKGKKPFCSTCEHTLDNYEYLPIINFIVTKGYCIYCKTKVDITYYILEIFFMFLFLIIPYYFGFTYNMISNLFFAWIFFTAFFIYIKKKVLCVKLFLVSFFILTCGYFI